MPQPRTSLLLNKGRGLVLHKGCAFGVLSPDWCTASGVGIRHTVGMRIRIRARTPNPTPTTKGARAEAGSQGGGTGRAGADRTLGLGKPTALDARSTMAVALPWTLAS